MTLKDKFSGDEWSRVLEAPMLAGFAITAADPGGLIGAVQESAAVAGSLKTAADAGEGSLAYAVAEAYKTSEGRTTATDGVKSLVKGKRPTEASEAAVARLGETFAMIERSAPEQAAGFRSFLIETAEKTAEAAKEGTFLGFGGEQVSDAERRTLEDIRAALAPTAA